MRWRGLRISFAWAVRRRTRPRQHGSIRPNGHVDTLLLAQSYPGALAKQGVYSAEQRRARQQQALALDQSVSELASQIISLESQRTDLTLQLARLPSDVAQTRASILESIEALEEKPASANANHRRLAHADCTGVAAWSGY